MDTADKLIIALDADDFNRARQLVDTLHPAVRIFKVGSRLFTAAGPAILQLIRQKGAAVFLDLKFHDIPNTVSHAVGAACRYNPLMLTVHTLGGSRMLQAAVKARDQSGAGTKILGVTILTSLDKGQLEEIGFSASMDEQVLCLAQIAKAAGLDGIVVSPQEVSMLRQKCAQDFIIVTPGIRPTGPLNDDQRRTAGAKEAVLAGADYIVVGRAITRAPDPGEAAKQILREIASVSR